VRRHANQLAASLSAAARAVQRPACRRESDVGGAGRGRQGSGPGRPALASVASKDSKNDCRQVAAAAAQLITPPASTVSYCYCPAGGPPERELSAREKNDNKRRAKLFVVLSRRREAPCRPAGPSAGRPAARPPVRPLASLKENKMNGRNKTNEANRLFSSRNLFSLARWRLRRACKWRRRHIYTNCSGPRSPGARSLVGRGGRARTSGAH
jgi:hypothetical protein